MDGPCMRQTVASGLDAGFEHHLVKPVEPDKLFGLLASLPVRG